MNLNDSLSVNIAPTKQLALRAPKKEALIETNLKSASLVNLIEQL
jgi:hypothetical protein